MTSQNKRVLVFVLIVFGISWGVAIPYRLADGKPLSLSWRVVTLYFMFTPMLATVIVQKIIFRRRIKRDLGVSFTINRWFVVAWLLPFAVAIAAGVISLLMPGSQFTADFESSILGKELLANQQGGLTQFLTRLPIHPFFFFLLQGLVAGPTINAITGFGEELGWRGFLQSELSPVGFWKSSAVIGIVWGLWHAPVNFDWNADTSEALVSYLVFMLLILFMTPVFAFIKVRSGSVIAASILHGSFNAVAHLSYTVLSAGNKLLVGWTGAAGIIVLGFLNLVIFFNQASPKSSEALHSFATVTIFCLFLSQDRVPQPTNHSGRVQHPSRVALKCK